LIGFIRSSFYGTSAYDESTIHALLDTGFGFLDAPLTSPVVESWICTSLYHGMVYWKKRNNVVNLNFREVAKKRKAQVPSVPGTWLYHLVFSVQGEESTVLTGPTELLLIEAIVGNSADPMFLK